MTRFKYLKPRNVYQALLTSLLQLKGHGVTLHGFCRAHKVYENILAELTKVLLNGTIIWIVLFPTPLQNPLWFAPSYGLAYVLLLELIKDVKQCLK